MKNSFIEKITNLILVMSMLLWLSACATGGTSASGGADKQSASSSDDKKITGTLLIFSEREAGSASFTTRIFINSKYMRMSDSLSRQILFYSIELSVQFIMLLEMKNPFLLSKTAHIM